MSRLTSMSPEALKAIFSPETDTNLITTVTIYDPDNVNNVVLRLCDSFTKRISETAEEVIYGITWKGSDYTFLPMEISLPTEEQGQAPKCSITMFDVTRYVVPIVRTITGPPKIKLDLLLSKYVEPGNALFNTNAEVATLKNFVENTIRGTIRFGFPHPRTNTIEEVRIIPQGDSLFTTSYLAPGYWTVSLQLEVLP